MIPYAMATIATLVMDATRPCLDLQRDRGEPGSGRCPARWPNRVTVRMPNQTPSTSPWPAHPELLLTDVSSRRDGPHPAELSRVVSRTGPQHAWLIQTQEAKIARGVRVPQGFESLPSAVSKRVWGEIAGPDIKGEPPRRAGTGSSSAGFARRGFSTRRRVAP